MRREEAAPVDTLIHIAPTAAEAAPRIEHSPLPTPHSPLLLFEQVSKWYGTVLALNQVTLELTGGITGLVGANGAGKSTLLRMANGQLKPTMGRVSVRGVDAWDWRTDLPASSKASWSPISPRANGSSPVATRRFAGSRSIASGRPRRLRRPASRPVATPW